MKTYVMLNHPCDNNANIDFKMTAYQSKIEINIWCLNYISTEKITKMKEEKKVQYYMVFNVFP